MPKRHIITYSSLLTILAFAGSTEILASPSARAASFCSAISAPSLELATADCTAVWAKLRATGAFPDVFAAGKTTNICYMSTGPATATIGKTQVTISSVISGWTTDFVPVPYGGTDNLGTAVTLVTIAGIHGLPLATLYTRDTVDFSTLATNGVTPEEDVIVGGSGFLTGARGTYRAQSMPEDPAAAKVAVANLSGELCLLSPIR